MSNWTSYTNYHYNYDIHNITYISNPTWPYQNKNPGYSLVWGWIMEDSGL